MSVSDTDPATRRAYDRGYRFMTQGINLASYLEDDWDSLATDDKYETLHGIRQDLEGSLLYDQEIGRQLERLGRGHGTAGADDLEESWWQGFADRVFDADQYSSLEDERDIHADVYDREDRYEVAADLEGLHAIDIYAAVEGKDLALYENGVIEHARLDVPDVDVDTVEVTEDDVTNGVMTLELPRT